MISKEKIIARKLNLNIMCLYFKIRFFGDSIIINKILLLHFDKII